MIIEFKNKLRDIYDPQTIYLQNHIIINEDEKEIFNKIFGPIFNRAVRNIFHPFVFEIRNRLL